MAYSPQTEAPPIKSKKPAAAWRDAEVEDDLDGGALDAEARISTRQNERAANADGGGDAREEEQEPQREKDAGKPEVADEPEEEQARDAGAERDAPAEQPKVDAECTRARLRERADAYLQSLTTGDTSTLRTHPSFRYTENGRDEELGAGAWLRRGERSFARHVLDETRCSSLTQAVMSGFAGRFSFGVRLRYSAGQLLEAEAQVVPELLAATDLDALTAMTDDAFVAEVPASERMTRAELVAFAQRYFDSVIAGSSVPPSAPNCRRLQNGLPLGDGTCSSPPGTARFEQQRFDLTDEPSGIVAATVLYDDHIGFYLLKISNQLLQDIHIIGGATSQATGW